MERQKSIVVTGAGQGIGRALAEEAHHLGFRVYATDASTQGMEDLKKLGVTVQALNITHSAQIDALLKTLEADNEGPDYWVNNAGYGAMGPLLDLSGESLEQQFEVNVFAQMRLIRAISPRMIERGEGCIANMGSIAPEFPTPFSGAYAASKAALITLSDTLRMELAPFGIDVVTIRPGRIRSSFGHTAQRIAQSNLSTPSMYSALRDAIDQRANASQQSATAADVMARQVLKQLIKERRPTDVYVGKDSRRLPWLRRLLPTRLLEWGLKRVFRLHTLSKHRRKRVPYET